MSLTDPRLAGPMMTLHALCETAEAWNDPRVSHDSAGVHSKPESRAPGHTQCEALVRKLERIMRKAASEADYAVKHANIRDSKPDSVHSVGGVAIPEEEPMRQPVYKGKTRKVSVDVTRRHLIAKYLDE